MEKFFAAVRNMFNVPDLRRRIFFTLGCSPSTVWARTSALPASTKSVWTRFGATLPERFSACSISSPAETSAPSPSSLLASLLTSPLQSFCSS